MIAGGSPTNFANFVKDLAKSQYVPDFTRRSLDVEVLSNAAHIGTLGS